jgi:uncharacterized repeat protein (TIGR01451 family)
MRKLLLVLVSTILLISFCYAQSSFGLQYSRAFGNTWVDRGLSLKRTPDGGSMAIGESSSYNGGDVTDNHGGTDIWVVKLNENGILEWKKSYGGSNTDLYRGSIQYPDGSTIIFSQSLSNDGDVTGNHGGGDIWAFKIDGSGSIIWKRSLGGSLAEEFRYADTTSDGGCIVAGYTTSNDGDVSGNHGGEDIWIVKLSTSGSINFQKCLGGTSTDRPRFVMNVPGNNFVMVGSTGAGNGDVTGWHGSNDVWVVKFGSTGNIIWQKALGGTLSDTGYRGVLSDNGSITVMGNTISVDGDVTGRNNNSTTYADVWIVNLDFANGNINWQKAIGGSNGEIPVQLLKNSDGSFLVLSNTQSGDGESVTNHHAGSSDILLTTINSNGSVMWAKCYGGSKEENIYDVLYERESNSYVIAASTDSQNGDVTGLHPHIQPDTSDHVDAWVMLVDHTGAIQWQRCFGGSGEDFLYSIQKAVNNEYYLTGESWSLDGDLPNRNSANWFDLWMAKIGFVNVIKGTVYLDANNNGIKDPGEVFFTDAVVETRKVDPVRISVPGSGFFIHEVDTGHFVTSVVPNQPYFTVVPPQATSDFSTYFNKDSFSFAVQVLPNKKDLMISAFALTASRPGFPTTYKLFYKNAGTIALPSFTVDFIKDHRLNFLSASPGISSSIADTLVWNFNHQLNPGDTGSILMQFSIPPPPTVKINDTLTSYAVIKPVDNDETPNNNFSYIVRIATGAYDPNEKTESNGGIIPSSFITNNYSLQFTVRFQNTGTDTAFNLYVRDTLDPKLNWSTLEMVTASHPYVVSIENGNQLTWQFNNINLPDSNNNEPASHGYIVYRVRPNNNVNEGDVINNTASIYFDYNVPVATNTSTTLVAGEPVVLPVSLLDFTGQATGNAVLLNWKTGDASDFNRFEIERSFDGRNYNSVGIRSGTTRRYSFEDDLSRTLPQVVFYRLKMIDNNGTFTYSRVLVFRMNAGKSSLLVYPNPAKSDAFVVFNSLTDGKAEVRITDVTGKLIHKVYADVKKGNSVLSLDVSALAKGTYLVHITMSGVTKSSKLIIGE